MHRKMISSKAVILFFLSMFISSLNLSIGQVEETIYTYIPSQGIGNIAVRIECPVSPRYPDGAPIVVEVSTWFVSFVRFHRVNDTKRIGAVTISYLWPGRLDAETGMRSDGEYDYGGPVSLSALKDVIRFASGLTMDVDGHSLAELSTVPVLTNNVGLFASSHSGVVATNVLAYFGNEIPSVKYLVGRENPTRDEMYPLEIGHFDGSPASVNKVDNPFYDDEIYLPDSLVVDYSTVGWYHPEGEEFGRPYFASKGLKPEHVLAPDKIPKAYDKRYYSRNLTRALLENGALTLESWPDYLATPAETASFWPYRVTVNNYPDILSHLPELKVMLVFSRFDHVQSAISKPHIHQAWDGFFHQCGFWVRMNPDRAYATSVNPGYGQAFPDNLANREPGDWIYIEDWGFPTDTRVRGDIWLASVAEMADRVYMNDWSDNIESVFFPVLIDTGTGYGYPLLSRSKEGRQHQLNIIPNPFVFEAIIQFDVYNETEISVDILNSRGRVVKKISKEDYLPGTHQILFSGSDMSSGIYYCRLQSERSTEYKKLILLK